MSKLISRILMLLIATLATPSFTATPAHFWSLHAGDVGDRQNVAAIAIVPGSGDIVATGTFTGTIDLGSGPLTTPTIQDDMWVARFTRSGVLKWAKRYGGFSSERARGVAVDAAGNIYLTGTLGEIDFGGGTISSAGQDDFYVAKLDPNGKYLWAQSHGGTNNEAVMGLVVDPAGSNVYVIGWFAGTTQLGGFTGVQSTGGSDAFIAKYNSSTGEWQGHWIGTGTNDALCLGAAIDPSGNVYVAGAFAQDITWSPTPTLVSGGSLDMFLLKIAPNSTIPWSQRRGDAADEILTGIAADASGNVVVTGSFNGTTNLGAGNLVSAGGSLDIFLAKYNTSGTHQWSYRFGGNETDIPGSLAMTSSGVIFLTGYCGAGTNFGSGLLPNAGALDAFIAKFSSSGSNSWSRSFGGAEDDRGNTIAIDASSNVVVGGYYKGLMNLGGANMPNGGGEDLFLAKFGIAEPAITSIKDAGNDQGRNVRITLARSNMDDGTAVNPITEYQAFRRILPLPSVALRGPQPVPSGTWEHVASVPASNANSYRMIAPTEADSTIALGMYRTKFFVRAATDDPAVFFDSPVDSGYSLDNLAPGIPTNFVYSAGTLTWDESTAADFDYFSIYGSSTDSFGAATLIDYAVGPSRDVSTDIYNYYWVTATDFSGNEGKPAKVSPLSGAGDGPRSYALSVSAYPNPFNPETTVRYTVPARGHVELAVYDLRGERVTTLVDRNHEAGAFTASWNGRNHSNETVGSGVYFARLKSQGANRTYKLVLLK